MFLGEFSIYGDQGAQCLTKTWFGVEKKSQSSFVIAPRVGSTGTAAQGVVGSPSLGATEGCGTGGVGLGI